MNALFITILNISVSASVVALCAILIRLLLKGAPKIYSYALWGVVLFRLVCPVNFNSNFSLMPASINVIPQDLIFHDNPQSQNVLFTNYIVKYEIETGISDTLPPNMPVSYLPGVQTFLVITKYIWLCGVVVLLLYGISGYIRLKKRVYFATLLRENIYETDQIKTPFVLGFIRPKIYVPVTVDPLQKDYIIGHEQFHIRRRDYLLKPIVYFALALHWFNPLVWLCYFLISADMEMSCDEAVLRRANKDIREEYSTLLLQFSSKKTSLLYPLAFGENCVKSRIRNVLYFKSRAAWVAVAALLAVVTFSVGFTFNTDLTANGQNTVDSVDTENVTHIGITGVPSLQARMIEDKEQIERIVNLIKNIEIQKIYFPINTSKGELVQYEMYFKSGKMTVIGIYESHIVINGQWYIANDEVCEQLSVLGVRLVGSNPERIAGAEGHKTIIY